MDAYRALTAAGTPTRAASGLTGIARATADRDAARPTPLRPQRHRPVNALTPEEKARVLALLDSPEFVDAAPAQVYAGLLAGKAPGESVGRPSTDQAEIARLTRELEVTRAKLSRTQTALEIMGKDLHDRGRSPVGG